MQVARTRLIVLAVSVTAAAGELPAPATPAGACSLRPTATGVRLPAAVTITTSCGTFEVGRDGRVRRRSASRSRVPRGAVWWPSSGVFARLERGHLVVGRWHRQLWRSHGRFRAAYEIGSLAVGARALAFSYDDGLLPRLYVAPFGGRERAVADDEDALGWTAAGLYTRHRDGELLLRSRRGSLRASLSPRVTTYAYDAASGDLYFLAHGMLVRAHGAARTTLAPLAALGLSSRPDLQLLPLGSVVALRDAQRLVVLRANGSTFAAAALPPHPRRADGVSSELVAAPHAAAVAFTATLGNSGHGSRGRETVYVLRRGDHRAHAIHRERIRFAICERAAELSWHGRWLLYAATERRVVVIDSARPGRTVDLSGILRRLPGTAGGEGGQGWSAFWTTAQRP